MSSEKVKKAFEDYWAGRDSSLTDEEYDQLVEEQIDLKNQIGGKKGKIFHEIPMLSLEKVYSYEDLRRWILKVSRNGFEKFDVRFKFDGLAGLWENGVFSTRGDGHYGEDITSKVPIINLISGGKSTPLYSHKNERILGEIISSFDTFEKWRHCDEIPKKHPRNFVAGMINRKKDLPDGLSIDFVEYESSKTKIFMAKDFTEKFWEETSKEFMSCEYPTDGIVISLADKKYGETLGKTEHHPLSSIAFKFSGMTFQSKILEIEWSAGKEALTPVAIIDPVEISGVTVSRATLHNYENVLTNHISAGDEVVVKRSGEVIPFIVSTTPTENSVFKIPEFCPCCGAVLEVCGVDLTCSNPECDMKKLNKLIASVKTLNMKNVGEQIVEDLYLNRGIDSLKKLMNVTYSQLITLERKGEKSVDNILKSIYESRKTAPETFLAALNIEGVGKGVAKKILEKFSLEELISIKSRLTLTSVDGIGDSISRSIIRYMQKHQEEVKDLMNEFVFIETPKSSGETICFTGKMPEKRSFYEEEARKRGLVPVSDVTSSLKFLVISEAGHVSSKTKKAEKCGAKVITLEDWL